jgi:hypothetical protein
VQLLASILPLATVALIATLILRSRLARGSTFRIPIPRTFGLPKRKKYPKLVVLDRSRMDDDLKRLLKRRR